MRIKGHGFAMAIACTALGLGAGVLTAATAGDKATDSPNQDPSGGLFAEFARPPADADAVDGKTAPGVDRGSARTVKGGPGGWRIWVAKADLPEGRGACVLYYSAEVSEAQIGPASVCDIADNVKQRGLGFIARTATGSSDLTTVVVAPSGVTLTPTSASQTEDVAAGPGQSEVATATGDTPEIEIESPAGGSQSVTTEEVQ